MKLKKLSYKYIIYSSIGIIFLFVCFFISSSPIFSRDMTPEGFLRGTVRVNICGDYIAEAPEECDREDFRLLSCTDYGYPLGTLSCNLACEINTSGCYNTFSVEENNTSVIVEPEKGVVELPVAIQFLMLFDEDGDGIISASEIPALMVNWINLWKAGGKGGDLNGDGESNIYDFSILMYHITYPD